MNKDLMKSFSEGSKMRKVVTFLNIFFDSFDTKNWNQMKDCLDDELELDYESFRGTPRYITTSDSYISKRKLGLKNLTTKHHSSNHIINEYNGEIKCTCNYEIKRYEINSQEYFHSFGQYELWIKKIGNTFKIYKIIQTLERNEGNKNIHGAFKF